MKVPLKLNAIDQEHLQELYDASRVARDELPYTEPYDVLVQGFQDRTFKNADPEQVYGALLKYTRSSTNAAAESVPLPINEDQMKQLKAILSRHRVAGKVLPYSDEFGIAKNEFNLAASMRLEDRDFWRSVLAAQGGKRRPPPRKKAVAAVKEDDGDDAE